MLKKNVQETRVGREYQNRKKRKKREKGGGGLLTRTNTHAHAINQLECKDPDLQYQLQQDRWNAVFN